MAPIWIFGYGSLLWDPERSASNFKKGLLNGWHREYNQISRVSRGTETTPGIALGLEPGGLCEGFFFQMPEREFSDWKKREGVNNGAYLLKDSITNPYEIKLHIYTLAGTKEFNEKCYVLVSNKSNSRSYCGNLSLRERAQIAINSSRAGGGRRGTSVDYIKKNYESYLREYIHDRALKEMFDEITILEMEESQADVHWYSNAVTNVEVYDSPANYGRYQIGNTDLIIGLPKEIRAALQITGQWGKNEMVVVHHGLHKLKVKAVQTDSRLTPSGTFSADNPANHCWMTPAAREKLGISELPKNEWIHRSNYPAFRKKYSLVKIKKD